MPCTEVLLEELFTDDPSLEDRTPRKRQAGDPSHCEIYGVWRGAKLTRPGLTHEIQKGWNAETRLARRIHVPGDTRQRTPQEEPLTIPEVSTGGEMAGILDEPYDDLGDDGGGGQWGKRFVTNRIQHDDPIDATVEQEILEACGIE